MNIFSKLFSRPKVGAHIQVYLRDGRVLVDILKRIRINISYGEDEVYNFDANDSAGIGALITEKIFVPVEVTDAVDFRTHEPTALIRAASVKRWGEFARSASTVLLAFENNQIRMRPYFRDDTQHGNIGFTSLDNEDSVLSGSSLDVGRAVVEKLRELATRQDHTQI